MYRIKFHGKRFGSKQFSSYEEARQRVRKEIRARFPNWKNWIVNWGNNNPAIAGTGFKIEAV